jgi:transcription regulator MmyB-like protein
MRIFEINTWFIHGLGLFEAAACNIKSLDRAAVGEPAPRSRRRRPAFGRRRTRPPRPAARRPHPRGPQTASGNGAGPGQIRNARAAGLAGSPARGGIQRTTRHPRGQRAGTGALRTGVRPARTAHSARFLFLDEPRAREVFPEWDRIAGDTVAMLRTEASRHPDDPRAHRADRSAVSTRSTGFRTRWAANDVRRHGTTGA